MMPFVVDEIRKLSQEEGLYDREIAEKLGCSRITVQSARSAHGIPVANIRMRKDKSYVCPHCMNKIFIRRYEPRRGVCSQCESKLEGNVL